MHRTEAVELTTCAACGVEVATTDRVFGLEEDEVICFECAVARGGIYNERLDRWDTVPDMHGLMPLET